MCGLRTFCNSVANMSFLPKTNYDVVDKIWSSEKEELQFGEDLSIGEIIFQEMVRHPKSVAQISDSEKTILLREDLLNNAIRIATFMRKLGLTETDIVGVIARNTTHVAAVAYACFFNGIAMHTLNSAYLPEIIEKLFLNTKPRIIFCDGDEYEKIRSTTAKLNVRIVTMRNHPAGVLSIQEVLKTPAEEGFKPTPLKQGSTHPLAILSTSGTTGTPKAVIVSNCRTILSGLTKVTTSDIQYVSSSLDWASCLWTVVSSGVFSTKRIVSEEPFDPSETLRIIEEYKVTYVLQSPAQVAAIVSCRDFEKANLHSLRYYYFGGGRCTAEVQKRLRQKLGKDIIQFCYGASELGSLYCVNWHYDAKPNSVGRPSPGYKVKILNDQGDKLGPNEEGEVFVYNGSFWPGYYGNPEATKGVYRENWYQTGDLGYVDVDGFVYIVERKKDLLKYHSNKYYPHDLEELISQMPGVVEACVFGIWNVENGDEAAAIIAKKPNVQLSEKDVIDFVAQHASTKFLRLHAGCLIANDLKRSPNGKTNRAANKEYFIRQKGIQIQNH
ncbi:luciferin 4-monooxygenase-like [Drosophila subpulchrella]|uniref:luciferin 4-monooxygenase-like n=1 Tax=Drosophila subpulchrella TaxID=1486046 RepID=UPI0018A17FDB|nr:luciferin 4-monooxygenase-like [Drosophila subpulchrella]